MPFKDESIIGRVENVIFAGKLSILHWDIIFTNKELIFTKMVKKNWIIIFAPLVLLMGVLIGPKFLFFMLIALGILPSVVASTGPKFAKKKRAEMKEMSISEMLADDKDNFKLTREELKNIEIKRGNALVKPRILIKKERKKLRLSFNKKEDIATFLSLLERVKTA